MDKATPRVCPECGGEFSSTIAIKKYCTIKCCDRAVNRNKRRTTYRRTCPHCVQEFVTRVKTQVHCSVRCSGLNTAPAKVPFKCLACGVEFMTRGRKCCSRRCIDWFARYGEPRVDVTCGSCFLVFAPVQHSQRYCSVNCAMGATNKRRRARSKAAKSELISPYEIFERDGWVCQICDGPIDRSGAPKQPNSPTIDHVVPISSPVYPGHIASNLAAAHWRCNTRKGKKSLAEIRLIIQMEKTAA